MKPPLILRIHLLCFYASINLMIIPVEGLCAENFREMVKQPVGETLLLRQETQKAEDEWALKKEKLAAQYDALVLKRENEMSLRKRLKKEILFQEERIKSLDRQIGDAARIGKEIMPYLNMLHKRLTGHVDGGKSYLLEERIGRLRKLRSILDDPGISVSEKFRKLMEAVQIEAEYGNTIEVYPQQINLNGSEIQTKIFRLGRISLFFQSLDQKTCGYFDSGEGQWHTLPTQYNRDITAAIEMGEKRRPVELVHLPLGRISVK